MQANIDRQTEQTNRETDQQTDIRTDKQTYKDFDGQKDKQTLNRKHYF